MNQAIHRKIIEILDGISNGPAGISGAGGGGVFGARNSRYPRNTRSIHTNYSKTNLNSGIIPQSALNSISFSSTMLNKLTPDGVVVATNNNGSFSANAANTSNAAYTLGGGGSSHPSELNYSMFSATTDGTNNNGGPNINTNENENENENDNLDATIPSSNYIISGNNTTNNSKIF